MLARTLPYLAAFLASLFLARPVYAGPEEETVESATTVLKELNAVPLKGIPASLLAEAHGVVIVPHMIKVGLVVGGERGKGVVVVKEKDGHWRTPTFITLTGGSVGLQAGAQATDIVLVFKTQRSVEGLMKDQFTIGADAAAAAGPVGRRLEAATDAQLKAEILSYSRSRGLFAGVSLDGAALRVDGQANAAYYGPGEPGQVVPESARRLVELIAQTTAHPEPAVPLPAQDQQPTLVAPTPQPAAEAEGLKRELASAATQLSGRLDDGWRRYLALPAEVYHDGAPPAAAVLKASQSRFDVVASDPQYRMLAQQREFQVTRDLLQAYINALAAQGEPKLILPPPPASGQP